MGNYIQISDVAELVGQTRLEKLVREVAGETAYDTVVERLIGRAEARIDGYLGTRYATPVAATGLVVDWALALVAHRVQMMGQNPTVQKKVEDEYLRTIEDLKAISAGDQDLAGATAGSDVGSSGVDIVSDTPAFDEDSMELYGA